MTKPIEARAAVVRAARGPAGVETVLVDQPGPGEVLVRVLASGVCHSDLHAKQGHFGSKFPYVLGHEATGVVEAVGPGVTRPEVGERVTLCYRAPCGACRYCARGRADRCVSPVVSQPRMRTTDGAPLGRVLGLGTFATHVVAAAGQAIPLGDDLPPEATCLIGCAVTTGVGAALNTVAVEPGATVAVFGCGAIGLSVIQGAKLAHASKIIGVDLVPGKLEHARRFGATDVVDARAGDPVARIRELTGAGVDYAFEAVGLPLTLGQALKACDVAGTCVFIGVPPPKAELALELPRFFFNRGILKATFYGDIVPSRDFPRYAGLYRQGALDLDAFVSERIRLEDVEAAFARMERGETLRSVIVF